MNTLFIEGRLVKDAEVRETKNGKPVTKFRIAHNKWNKAKQEEETSFFNVTTYREMNLTKGTLVMIEGSLDAYDYSDDSGRKTTYTYVLAFKVTPFNPIKKSEYSSNQSFGATSNVAKAQSVFGDDMNIPF